MVIKINNKIKQKSGGNWGHPRPYIKKHTNIPDEVFQEVPKHGKRKKRKKKPYVSLWSLCPFCNQVLPESKEKEPKDSVFYVLDIKRYVARCVCGAKGEHECPSCYKETWYKDGVYKHQKWSCGFEGEKKYANTKPIKTKKDSVS